MIYEESHDHKLPSECSTVHALVILYFPANGLTNQEDFQPKTICTPRAIIPQNFSSLGFSVLEELGNKQTHRLNHSLTSYCLSQMLNIYNIYIHQDHRKILIQDFSALIFLKCEKTYLYVILATQHNLCMYGREELNHFSLSLLYSNTMFVCLFACVFVTYLLWNDWTGIG